MGNVLFDASSYRHKPTLLNRGGGNADAELIACILAGDLAAQEAFVMRFGPLILAILCRLHLSQQDREDLYQQTFIHLWENNCHRLRLWQESRGKFRSFLGVVVVRLAYDTLAIRSRQLRLTEMEPGDLPALQPELAAQAYAKQRLAAVACALRELRPRDAALITARHSHGLTYKEMADAMGITVNHVGVALARAEQRLHSKLCTDYPDLFDVQKSG